MKKIIVRSSLLVLLTVSTAHIYSDQKPIVDNKKTVEDDGLFLLDDIKAIIYGQERTDLITYSDVARPSIDGKSQTLEDLVLSRLICQDASRYKMDPDNEAVDKHLKAVQRENNLSLDDLKHIFSSAGYTYEEGREQFRIMTAVGSMVDFRVRSRLIVPEKDIQAYYKEHPLIKESAYQVERAQVEAPYGMDHAQFLEELQKLIDTGKTILDVQWSEPFWINKSELAQDKQFLTTLEVGCIAMGAESAAGTELFKLMNKKEEHIVSLEERYNEIADLLKRPKYTELFEQYKKDLFNNAAVVYF